MRRIAILVALAACEPEDSGDGSGGGSASSVTTAPAESSEGSESGEENPCPTPDGGECPPEALCHNDGCFQPCLTPGGDLCPFDAKCWDAPGSVQLYDEQSRPGGSVCLEPCSQTGQCKTGTECAVDLVLDGVNVGDVCADFCHFQGGVYGWQPSCGNEGDDSDLACADYVVATYPSMLPSGICVWPEG